ncbi:hypothetical protein BDQ17DRAFT_1325727 [Cyathus striatus]|nr:hypothetical protein BDQ17DRAFT_1325727 [Cyathus striatus]
MVKFNVEENPYSEYDMGLDYEREYPDSIRAVTVIAKQHWRKEPMEVIIVHRVVVKSTKQMIDHCGRGGGDTGVHWQEPELREKRLILSQSTALKKIPSEQKDEFLPQGDVHVRQQEKEMSKITKTGKLRFGVLGHSPKGWRLFVIASIPPVQSSPQVPQSQLQKALSLILPVPAIPHTSKNQVLARKTINLEGSEKAALV